MLLRILVSLLLLFSILFMPFWLSVFLAFAGMAYFSFFFEAVFLFFLLDLIYGLGKKGFLGIFFISFAISIIFLILIEFLKKKLKFYS